MRIILQHNQQSGKEEYQHYLSALGNQTQCPSTSLEACRGMKVLMPDCLVLTIATTNPLLVYVRTLVMLYNNARECDLLNETRLGIPDTVQFPALSFCHFV